MRASALALLVIAVNAGAPAPPDPKKLLKQYTINLDSAPEDRWTEAVQDHKNEIKAIVQGFKILFNKGERAQLVAALKQGMPDEYLRELQGISTAAKMDYDNIIMANAFYELTSFQGVEAASRACTSIVAQNANGSMYLARNMDYPPPLSVLQIDAQFVRGGLPVYRGTTFAGTIGIMTGVIPGSYAMAINARDRGVFPTFQELLAVASSGGWIAPVVTRAAFEAARSFDDAVDFLMTAPMIAPAYAIIGGAAPGQGAVVTTNSSAAGNDLWRLKDAYPREAERWYTLQTNWDHWEADSETDGRRPAGIAAMDAIGSEDITIRGLWNTLATAPVYNSLTINTQMIDIGTGESHAYLRHNIVEQVQV